VKSLLESLQSWDPRASVPLALTYMRYGDPEVLDGFDEMALANPAARDMLGDRYLTPSPDVEYLASLPEDTLGKRFEQYLAGVASRVRQP